MQRNSNVRGSSMTEASRANPRTIQTLQSWDAMREALVWNVPDMFNIAEACCDRWAALAPYQIALI